MPQFRERLGDSDSFFGNHLRTTKSHALLLGNIGGAGGGVRAMGRVTCGRGDRRCPPSGRGLALERGWLLVVVRVPGAGAEEWAGPRCACAFHSTRRRRRRGRGKMEDFQASEEVTPGWATGGWWPRSRRGAAQPGKPQLLLSTATRP